MTSREITVNLDTDDEHYGEIVVGENIYGALYFMVVEPRKFGEEKYATVDIGHDNIKELIKALTDFL